MDFRHSKTNCIESADFTSNGRSKSWGLRKSDQKSFSLGSGKIDEFGHLLSTGAANGAVRCATKRGTIGNGT